MNWTFSNTSLPQYWSWVEARQFDGSFDPPTCVLTSLVRLKVSCKIFTYIHTFIGCTTKHIIARPYIVGLNFMQESVLETYSIKLEWTYLLSLKVEQKGMFIIIYFFTYSGTLELFCYPRASIFLRFLVKLL